MLVFWIYLDAGGGKWMDPQKGWTYNASPLPALDTYTRHTTFAQYLYGILGPQALRMMTPTVVYVELLSCPLALLGSYLGNVGLVKFAVGLICQLHVGISLSIRNSTGGTSLLELNTPGMLRDGSVVDVWGRKDHVDWTMPGTGAPCTATSRPGRWRSFPYLADLEGDDADALWGYLCKQWDYENNADVLPNMAFSATRKRLVYTYDCATNQTTGSEEGYKMPENEQRRDVESEEL
eukprot:scaffold22586_cov138-Cylindrotheca_fusiformis.AAC.8